MRDLRLRHVAAGRRTEYAVAIPRDEPIAPVAEGPRDPAKRGHPAPGARELGGRAERRVAAQQHLAVPRAKDQRGQDLRVEPCAHEDLSADR